MEQSKTAFLLVNRKEKDSLRSSWKLKFREERLLKSIGFKEIDGEYFSDMTGMFDGH